MKTRNKVLFNITLITSIIMIITGFILENKTYINNFISDNNNINLSISEINTAYTNKDYYVEKKEVYSKPIDTTWMWPTDTDYYITTNYSMNHPAIDIVSNRSLNAYAAYNGVVVTNSFKYDNGNYIVIKTDDNKYLMYAHLSEKFVNEGEKVNKGQIIGILGRTGYATGVHLHFAVWEGYPHLSKPINPYLMY